MQKDSSGLVAIILAALVFVGSGVSWYLSYDEVYNEQKGLKIVQIKKATDEQKASEDKLKKAQAQAKQVSELVGVQAGFDEGASVPGMVGILNDWVDRLAATDCKTKYAKWVLDEEGLSPALASGSESGGTGRDLCWIKDSRSAKEQRMANETPDQTQYLVAELETLKAMYEAEAANLESEAQRAIQQHDENVGDGKSQGRLGTVIDDKEKKIKELRDSIRNIEDQILRNQRESEQAIADAEKSVRLKLDELDAMKGKHEKAVAEKQKKIQELADRVFAITTKRQLARESTEADGMVINAVPQELFAWIDIGRKDALLKGTRFEVFTMLKGGRKVMKGMAEVVEVKENYSVITLLRDGIVKTIDDLTYEGKMVEKGNVVEITERNGNKVLLAATRIARMDYIDDGLRVEKGDYVANEVFDRKGAKTFVFGGKMRGRYTNEQMGNLLREFGAIVDKDVQSETTYLVVGADYETDPNYEKAKSLGVKIIREADLYELLGLQR